MIEKRQWSVKLDLRLCNEHIEMKPNVKLRGKKQQSIDWLRRHCDWLLNKLSLKYRNEYNPNWKFIAIHICAWFKANKDEVEHIGTELSLRPLLIIDIENDLNEEFQYKKNEGKLIDLYIGLLWLVWLRKIQRMNYSFVRETFFWQSCQFFPLKLHECHIRFSAIESYYEPFFEI